MQIGISPLEFVLEKQGIDTIKCTLSIDFQKYSDIKFAFTYGYGESSITEGLRTALARLRQKSSTPGSQSPSHQSPPQENINYCAPFYSVGFAHGNFVQN
ncbi:hypothetical protein WA026_002085 [Henosepilachna vigintioctopunctata]|uniref:Uncharacterized protein n=1 Tax=Henosepilachna vigintioctopunctata TaxID=420089 RepID=A0AAW1TTY0_9CUCU